MMRGLASHRQPATLAQAQAMKTYAEQQIAASRSPGQIARAQRLLVNLEPHLTKLATPPTLTRSEIALQTRRECDRYDVIWAGIGPLPGFEDRPGFCFRIEEP